MHADHDRLAPLFARIVAAMADGGRLTPAILDYVGACLFPVERDRLAGFLLDDRAESERESLLDLIFSPDPAVQIELEPLVAAAGVTPHDERSLNDRLLAQPIHAPIHMPDGRAIGRIRLPDAIKSQYLARLNLCRHPDPHVTAAIDGAVSPAAAAAVKVRIRNARLRPSDAHRQFLVRFFERMPDDDPDFLPGLDLVLPLLEHAEARVDVYGLLAAHKRSLFRSLQQADRFGALLRRSNMETLMLQGVRAHHAPRDELMRGMRLIDLVCVRVFGRTEAIAPIVNEPVRQVSDAQDARAAVDALLRDL